MKAATHEFVTAFENFVNRCSAQDMKDAAAMITCGTHRTLQQTMAVLMVECLKDWAKNYNTGIYDGRNEATCKLAKDLIGRRSDVDLMLPFI